jgi:hypothetical protein
LRATDEREDGSPEVGRGGGVDDPLTKGRKREALYDLQDDEMAAMCLIGAFRSVDAREIPSRRLSQLLAQGLVDRKSITLQRTGERIQAVVLTKAGRDLVTYGSGAQRYYAGLVKPAEVAHDLAIYPAFKTVAREIERDGGRVKRVVLDYEFKSIAARAMNRRDGCLDKAQRRQEVARALDLPVVDDHLALPDLRIEYVDAEGREQHRDIEVVTHHYRGSHMAGKQQAGFRLMRSEGGSGKPVWDDHHIGWI